jgi:uncharacterized protein (DUF488 family)
VPVIHTIGHSTRSWDAFLALLRGHGVTRLVDVRRYPGSRRHPHFSKEQLAPALDAAGIAYIHAVDLGGRRAPARDSPNGAWRSASFRAYADHMASPEFQAWLERLIGWSSGADTAIMCAEAVHWNCHRQLIADALVARGIGVAHITDAGTPAPHLLSPHAMVDEHGNVSYPPQATQGDQTSLF